METDEEEGPDPEAPELPPTEERPSALWVDIKGPGDLLYRLYINRTFRKLVPGLVLFSVILLLPTPDALGEAGHRALALFIFVVYLWVTETFPLPVTAFMAGVGLLVLGVYTGSGRTVSAFKMYAADAVFMVLGSLILAQGLVSSGADRLLAKGLLRRFSVSTTGFLIGIVLISALISAVIPGHTVAAFMLPVVYTIMMGTDIADRPNEIAGMIIAIAMGCEVGSLATPSGGARNAIAIGYLDDFYGLEVTYLEWVELALPLTLILIPITIVAVKLVFRIEARPLSPAVPEDEGEHGLRPYLGLAVLLTTIVLFLAVSDTLSLGTVAMIGGILMFVMGLLRWESVRGDLRWGVIFIYGAALTLGEALRATGAADWLASSVLGGLGGLSLFALITVVVVVAALFTNFVSDAAATALVLPVVLPIVAPFGALEQDVEGAFLLAMATTMASGFAYLTVFGTPPNTIVHASGYVTSRDFLKGGLVIWLASIVIMLLLVNTYWKWLL